MKKYIIIISVAIAVCVGIFFFFHVPKQSCTTLRDPSGKLGSVCAPTRQSPYQRSYLSLHQYFFPSDSCFVSIETGNVDCQPFLTMGYNQSATTTDLSAFTLPRPPTHATLSPSTSTTSTMVSWETYQNEEVDISFQYPKIFKVVNMHVVSGDTGRMFTGVLEFAQPELAQRNWISFGGATKDYSVPKGGSITDTQGYEKQGDAYFLKFLWGKTKVVPSEFWPVNHFTELAIFIRNTEIGQILSRDGVAVFVNIPYSSFTGIVFEIHSPVSGEQVDEKEIELLRQIVSSITFPQQAREVGQPLK